MSLSFPFSLCLSICFFILFSFSNVLASSSFEETTRLIQKKIQFLQAARIIECRKETLCGSKALQQFYAQRGFSPSWSNEKGIKPHVYSLLKTLKNARDEGLDPEDYHVKGIEGYMAEFEKLKENDKEYPEILSDLDILLTDAFFVYAAHMLTGRVNPDNIFSEWNLDQRNLPLGALLEKAMESGDLGYAWAAIQVSHPGYHRLKEVLKKYREIDERGGWEKILDTPRKMEKGKRYESVPALRMRLAASGDLEEDDNNDNKMFDEALDEVVRRFQERHGLEVDGVVGPKTLGALNVPVSQRIRQIEINLERWRWLPRALSSMHILINIADFHLTLVDKENPELEMKIIAGRTYRPTPVLNSQIDTVVINPYWNVPHKIATKDILPLVKKKPDYLLQKKIRVFSSWAWNAKELDPLKIDWSKVNTGNFTFKLRQDPGPINSLGRLKFIFKNESSVYLHGTPAIELFEKTQRAFSSGCIRVERPLELAVRLLDKNIPTYTKEHIMEEIEGMKTSYIKLKDPVPIHVLYWTSWVDKTRKVHFRNDIYGLDQDLYQALGYAR